MSEIERIKTLIEAQYRAHDEASRLGEPTGPYKIKLCNLRTDLGLAQLTIDRYTLQGR